MYSQVPFNQLPFIRDYKIHASPGLDAALIACNRALYRLDGYWEANPESNRQFARLIQVADTRYSMDMEQLPVSLGRLYEALASENLLRDKTSGLVARFLNRREQAGTGGISALEPLYALADAKAGDMLREKGDMRISSFYTGLTVYTAPGNTQIIRSLRSDLERSLNNLKSGDILRMSVLHFQIRALAPYTQLNGHVARNFSTLFLGKSGFLYDFLPLSSRLYAERETYNNLIRVSLQTEDLSGFCLFMCNALQEAAVEMSEKLKSLHNYKRLLLERLTKYTDFNLPAEGLTEVLFSAVFTKPYALAAALGCHRQTAYTYLKHLQQMGILSEKRSGREKLYLHKALLDILQN